jgi:hypothetical protein
VDDLPPDAKKFLALTKGVHDPSDPQARARIEQRIWSTLALANPAPSNSQQPPGMGAREVAASSWLSSKYTLIGVALVLAGGGVLWGIGPRSSQQADGPNDVAAQLPAADEPSGLVLAGPPTVAALAEPLPDAPGSDPAIKLASTSSFSGPRNPPAHHARRSMAPESDQEGASSLADEAALLARASAQLTQGNASAAAALLAEHQRRYPASQLGEEREGFGVMTDCLMERTRARQSARAFVTRNPASVLVPRIAHLCAL